MNPAEFARSIVFSDRLEDKLYFPDRLHFDAPPAKALDLSEVPSSPVRPKNLTLSGKARFPKTSELKIAASRGLVLHFFANHELLALELMALVVLRFPDAPTEFLSGVLRTLKEEQNHMRLYLARMQELGIQFGELPLSRYFWDCLKAMQSPLDFVVQMSLTFEQANLDYSLYYRDEIAKTNDAATARVLDQVYREEIGHVKHGLSWFNRWREPQHGESDWEAYLNLLPRPMSAQRAKGIFFSKDARSQAGFSQTFIEQLSVHSGSKGRPPRIWMYNPWCESEIARGKSGFTPTSSVRELSSDLESALLLAADAQDLVWASREPSLAWIKAMSGAGFTIPRTSTRASTEEKNLSGFCPWGWSSSAFEVFRPLEDRLVNSSGGNAAWCKKLFAQPAAQNRIGALFSKSWSVAFLRKWLSEHSYTREVFAGPEYAGYCTHSWDDLSKAIASARGPLAIKAPYGTSGNQIKVIEPGMHLTQPLIGWVQNIIETQAELIVEPWLAKVYDISMQLEITSTSVSILGIRHYVNGKQNQYRGTWLGKKLSTLDPDALRFFNQTAAKPWRELAMSLADSLRTEGYEGPAGIDALLWKNSDDEWRLKPVVEVNPRMTMGRVALEIEKHVAPGINAAWCFLPVKDLEGLGWSSAQDLSLALEKAFPIKLDDSSGASFISDGALCTNDPSKVTQCLTVLLVGSALRAVSSSFALTLSRHELT